MDADNREITVRKPLSSMWQSPPSDLNRRIQYCIDEARELAGTKGSITIFFRADDIGVPGKAFGRLMEVFAMQRIPLALAVVPAWLTRTRWQHLKGVAQNVSDLFCWHQHGWRHKNHEKQGKKSEFGHSRTLSEIKKDLLQGRQRLEGIMGKAFEAVFTPPWNRCDHSTLALLKKLEYLAVSRIRGSLPRSPDGLPETDVTIDLHTRKRMDRVSEWDQFFVELGQSLSSSSCGIMIHHNRMNTAAFGFLESLLQNISRRKGIQTVHLKDLVTEIRNG